MLKFMSFYFDKACAGQIKQQGDPYLHGDVCYGGGGQIKVLLDQNVEFGGQVPPRTNAVNLTGEQGRNLTQQERNAVRNNYITAVT